ncbi:MAG TPA: NAD(P)-dependent oxidoreductase [Solirubrobacteraceae bacterium]|nr:NAD(P)-dependent oxidoreductase [Solirubrobacteraceae bacterium]
MSAVASVGFVGLGAMGSRLAGRLLAAGNEVHGYNRSKEKAAELVGRGLIWHDTPREVAVASDIIITMVSDDTALDAISAGPDGILAGLSAGKIYIDMSTVSPEASVELARRVWTLGAEMLDAPVSGSVPQAEAGTLTIMVGGEQGLFALAEPILAELGTKVVHVGGHGKGLILKLAINISLAAQVIAFSEGLVLAERGGIDAKLAAEVMSESPIGSAMLKARLPLILDLPEQAWFDVALLHKDVRLALRVAEKLGTPLPSAQVADKSFRAVERLGYGHRDIAAVHEVLARHTAEMAMLIGCAERFVSA